MIMLSEAERIYEEIITGGADSIPRDRLWEAFNALSRRCAIMLRHDLDYALECSRKADRVCRAWAQDVLDS